MDWQHGHSTENDCMSVATQDLAREQLAKLNEEDGEKRSLLICCGAFRVKPNAFPHLMLKKITNTALSSCDLDKNDGSLRVENLPKAPPKIG